MPRRRHGVLGHVPDLLDEELPLVDELLVVGAVLEEVRQKIEELVAVHEQDLLDGNRFVRVGNEDFKYVETLVLHHLAVAPEQVHADLEVLAAVDVGRHDVVVGPVE